MPFELIESDRPLLTFNFCLSSSCLLPSASCLLPPAFFVKITSLKPTNFVPHHHRNCYIINTKIK
ncbi:hypothetical protein D5R40_22650 [Okeania hirsuta]|uniref:Uncharacterized protein n=1 Tax=Okeania hirsuta TaxID=1458930 RepID=A0A3N6PFI3_9CYAN|nr:hypothetical protein D4Z78_09760 [Okeania hirsuta]RQH32059.1 hypothetical protein D5R40_22650 [Okeania hirsuta]